jgi:hypothetical protein
MTPPFGLAPDECVDQRGELAAPGVDRVRLAKIRSVDLVDVGDGAERDRLQRESGGELLLQARQRRECLAGSVPAEPSLAPIRVPNRRCHVHRVHGARFLVNLNCALSAREQISEG